MCIFHPKDATVSLTPTELTVDEGSDPDSVNLCVVISNLPAGGLQCDLVATLSPIEDTACMYIVLITSQLILIDFSATKIMQSDWLVQDL